MSDKVTVPEVAPVRQRAGCHTLVSQDIDGRVQLDARPEVAAHDLHTVYVGRTSFYSDVWHEPGICVECDAIR